MTKTARVRQPAVLDRLGGREFLRHTGCRPDGEGSADAVALLLPRCGGVGRAVVFWLDPRYRVEFWRTGNPDGPVAVGEAEADTVAGVMFALEAAARRLAPASAPVAASPAAA